MSIQPGTLDPVAVRLYPDTMTRSTTTQDDRATPQDFAHVETWIFDLDNTLYHPSARLFDQIEEKMRHYLVREIDVSLAEADALRAQYWAKYGTTLAGMIANHNVDPMHFLDDVHDIDMGGLMKDPHLADLIARLPGRRIVHTNGDAEYAGRVLTARGLNGLFDAIYGIEHTQFVPKPAVAAYDDVLRRDGFDPWRAAMFEDDVRNLAVPHARGMLTVLVHDLSAPAPHVGWHTQDLTGFLSQLLAPGWSPRQAALP